MSDGATAHVLLVEDSDLVRDAMRVLIESAGHRMSEASSIAEALAVGAADPADLVLLDLTLPDGDGLTLIDPLLAAGSKRVISLTGRDDDATRRRCLDAGCIDVLVKPVPARDLVRKVAEWLSAG